MSFTFSDTPLKGVTLVESKIYRDSRGYFMESFKETDFKKSGIVASFVQDNHSFSSTGVIRGLHFQKPPSEQGKLVSVISGEIFDVAVDLRLSSKTFGKWFGTSLSDINGRMLWVPPGFAHGFQALQDSQIYYKTTAEYSQKDESGIRWNDSDLGIEWPNLHFTISDKDSKLPLLNAFINSGGEML